MKPNWFVAFPVEANFVATLPAPPAAIRCFPQDDVHLTLTFLGGVSEERGRAAFQLLREGLAERPAPAVDISLAQVVPMGRVRAYTALSALLADGREELEQWLTTWRVPLASAAGVRADVRPPKPHVTLARPQRRAGDLERQQGLAWAGSLDLSDVRARLDRVALYTWATPRGRRLFQIVDEHRLAPP